MSKVTGHTSYKGLTAQQHNDVFDVFKNFLSEIKPKRILEIGTAGGGFTLFLRDTLNELGLEDTPIKSFDVHECPWYDDIRKQNVEINIENIFDHSYFNLEKPEKIVPYIQEEGTTLVLCDGGHKIGEVNMISNHLKVGDYIMAHDYTCNIEYFNENIKNEIWNWCEITDTHIEQSCIKNNLEKYNEEEFQSVVWTCRKKVN
jgi:cephalosporin hydroxylase